MAKSTITFSVNADTKQAKTQLQGLKGQLDQVGKAGAAKGSKAALGGITDAFTKMAKLAAPVAAAGAALKVAYKGISSFTEAGKDAQQQYDKLSTVFGTLQRNLTGNGNAGGLVDFLQNISANGVNGVDDLATAAQKLMVAFNGDQGKVRDLIPLLDDIAVGTGKSVTEWAQLSAKVAETGVNTKTLNSLTNAGIPITKALAAAMGVTESEVKQLAEAGRISTEDWNNAVKELHKSYKGLSADLSNNTLQGAMDTAAANKGLANRGAAAATDEELKRYYSQQGQLWANRANDIDYQALSNAAGAYVGHVNAMTEALKEAVSPLNLATLAIQNLLPGDALDRFKKAARAGSQADLINANVAGQKLDDAATVAQLSNAAQAIKDAMERWQKMSGKSDAELAKDPAYARALKQLERLEGMKGTAETRETQQRVDEYGQTLIQRTLAEVLAGKGYKSFDAYEQAAMEVKTRLTTGKGTEADVNFWKEYERISKEHADELKQIAADDEAARRDILAKEDTRMKYADADTMKDIVARYMGYDASTGNISARGNEIRAGLADGSLEPSPELLRELSVIETYLAKIDEEAAEAAKTPEAIQSMNEAEAAEAAKQREVRTQAGIDTARQKGREWLRDNRGTAELSQLDREARSLTQLQRTRFNKTRAKNDSEYEENWKQAQELKKLGIKDVNAMREFKAGEKAEAAEKEKLQRMDTIINKLDTFAPTYQ